MTCARWFPGTHLAKQSPMSRVLDDDSGPWSRRIRVEAAMHGIVCYLKLHPEAADSPRGVQFWLRALCDELNEEIVTLALDELVEQGDIEARHVVGGTLVYGLARGSGDEP
jgi:hypothetical protein